MPKFFAFFALFLGLTAAGVAWAVSRAEVSTGDLRVILGFSASSLVLLAVFSLGIYASDVLRYQTLGRAVAARVSWRAGLDASVANFFFSWITPGSTFGAPATIYMLGRRGVPWDATVVIAFGKAFTGVAVVVVSSLLFVALGLGPDYDGNLLGLVIFGGSVFGVLFGSMIVAAMRPEPTRRVVAGLFGWLERKLPGGRYIASIERVTLGAITRLSHLRDGGVMPLLYLTFTHILYFSVFAAVGVVLIHGFGGVADFRAFAATVVYIAFTYLAPTPGGAGFAEAMAIPFFGPLLPAEEAVMMVLCFRGLTFYLQVAVGLPYMLIVGGIGAITARVAGKARSSDPEQ